MQASVDPRYPIGKFAPPTEITAEDRNVAIATLTKFPQQLRDATQDLSPEQFDTPYREGGWTVQQLVHHIADSHSIAMFRVKKALTEDWPTVPGYPEAAFATLSDIAASADVSLTLIESVHTRWVMLLQAFEEMQWERGYVHEERGRTTLDVMTLNYAWHSNHHRAHILELRKRQGW